MWKAKFKRDELKFLAEISKQNVKGAPWFLLASYSKMQEEIN